MNLDFIDDIFVQPASSDAGLSLGAAQMVSLKLGIRPKAMSHAYLGREYTDEEIERDLQTLQCPYRKLDDPVTKALELIQSEKVIGWFQGRSEFGPRALGARSILCCPKRSEMRDLVNQKVKFRESFRPFCPSVWYEDEAQYFSGRGHSSPFMNITFDVKDDKASKLQAVTHIDQTARIQTVGPKGVPPFIDLFCQLKQKGSIPVLLNTSFNLSWEPIVETPKNAIATFYGSGLDALIIGHFLLQKGPI
jgi:carbamoyltransferase